MTRSRWMLSLLLVPTLLVGCANETMSDDADRDEIRRLTQSRADLPRDLCEAVGFIGDGQFCDDFCEGGDPDCGTPCMATDDCLPIYCITAPCPQPVCIAGLCEVRGAGGACPAVDLLSCPNGVETDEFGCDRCLVLDPGACMTDTDCPVPLCLPGGPCPDIACVAGECQDVSDWVCRTDEECPQPACDPRGPCPDIDCVGGACVDTSDWVCRADDDCPQPACDPAGPCPEIVCSAGQCETRTLGESCDSSADCGAGQFCEGDCSGAGTCVEQPTGSCTAAITPYCGCDGETHYATSGCIYDRYEHGGACESPPDCRASGCSTGDECTFCWGNWACVPNGVLC